MTEFSLSEIKSLRRRINELKSKIYEYESLESFDELNSDYMAWDTESIDLRKCLQSQLIALALATSGVEKSKTSTYYLIIFLNNLIFRIISFILIIPIILLTLSYILLYFSLI
jgi:hypothetical protein